MGTLGWDGIVVQRDVAFGQDLRWGQWGGGTGMGTPRWDVRLGCWDGKWVWDVGLGYWDGASG